MSTNIKLKKSSISGRVPNTSDLAFGEIAINYADGLLYYKNSSNQIKSFIDSAAVQSLITSVSVGNSGLDSATVFTLIDSAYVQSREVNENGISSVSQYNYLADSGQTLFTGSDLDGSSLIFVNNENIQVFLNGILLKETNDYTTTSNNTITLTSPADSSDELRVVAFETYSQRVSLDDYIYTADSGQITFTGADNNNSTLSYTPGNVQVHLNGLLLLEDVDYTASTGTSIVFTESLEYLDNVVITAVSGDSAYLRSAVTEQFLSTIIDSAYVQARVSSDAGTDSSTVISLINDTADSAYIQSRQITYSNVSEFTNDAGYTTYDSANTTGMLSTYATQTYVTNQINNLVDGAPTTLDTLNEIAAALNDDDSAYATLNTLINTKTSYDSTNTIQLVNSAYVQARQSYDSATNAQKLNNLSGSYYLNYNNLTNTPNVLDSNNIVSLVDSAYVQARQSDSVTNAQQLNNLAGSYYLNYNNFTNTPNILDSVNVNSIVTSYNYTTYDSTNTTGMLNGYATEAYVDSQISSIIDGAPGALNTLNELAAALNDDDSAFATLNNLINTKTSYDSTNAAAQITAYGYTTYDSSNTIQLVDSAYVQARQSDSVAFADDAALLDGYNKAYYLSYNNFTNTPNVLDSAETISVVNDAGYTTYDSTNTLGLIDSAYINARVDAVAGTDSAATIAIIQSTVDSDYVLARIPDATLQGVNQFEFIADSGQTVFTGTDRDGNGLNYNSTDVLVFLNGTLMVPGNDFVTTSSSTITFTEGVDSGDFVNIFNFTAGRAVGGGVSEVNHFDFTADSGQTSFTGTDNAGSTLSFIGNDNIQVFINGLLLKQSGYTTTNNNTVTLGIAADSADEVRIIAYDTYSQRVAIDDYNFTADSGQTIFTGTDDDNNTLTFAPGNLQVHLNGIMLRSGNDYSTTGSGTVTLVSGADSGDTLTVTAISGDSSAGYQTIVTGLIDSAYIQARETSQDFAYSSLTGAPTTVSSFTNDANYLDSTTVTGIIDATYIQANQTTYDFLDSAEAIALIDSAYVQARQSNADQDLNTTDSVTFATLNVTGNTIIGGNLQVNGTTVTVNSEDLSVTDNMIYMNAGESAGSPTASIDVGWAANVNDDGSYAHVGMFRDATDNTFKVYEGYTPEPDAAVQINTAHASFSLAPFEARTLTGEYLGFDSDVTAAGLATQSYVTTTVDSAYVQLRQTPQDFAYSSLTGAPTTVSTFTNDANYLDSTTVQGVIDATYIQANQTNYTVLDSADVSSIIAATDLVDSTDVANIVEAYGYLTSAIDSTGVIALITANDQQRDSAFVTGIIDSAYINARVSATDSAAVVSIVTGTIDSAFITNIIDASYIQSNQITYVDSAYVATQITNLVDGAPTALDTLNELATALQNDSDALASLVTVVDTKLNTAGVTSLVDSAYVQSRQTAQDFAYSSLTGVPNVLDSTNVSSIVTSYGYSTFDSADVRTTRWSDNERLIMGDGSDLEIYHNGGNSFVRDLGTGNLVLDTNGISIVLSHSGNAEKMAEFFKNGPVQFYHNNSKKAETTIDGFNIVGGLFVDSVEVDSAFIQARQITYDFLDSAEAIALIATQGYLTDAIDSAATIALIQATVDSAYVAAREADAGGTDSATILALIQATVDSAYVAARDPGGAGGVTFRNYEYTADSGQTAFTGADTLGNSLAYTPNQLQVYRNGILLIDSSDYTATSSNTVTLTTASETGDNITVSTFTATVGATLSTYDYFADSGQTSFSGADVGGDTLSFSGSNVFVHVNGILLSDSNDYTRVGGSEITFDTGLDSGDIVSIIAITDTLQENLWREVTSTSYDAIAGTKLIVDASSSTVTVNLPTTASFGDEVMIIDGTGSSESNNITINRNGHKILGADSDFTVDVNRTAVDLVYYNATQGWIISGTS